MKMQLAKWREEFAGEIAVYANNKKIGDNLRDGFPFPYTEKDALEYIRGCTEKEEKGQFCRAIILDGLPAGSIGIFAGTNIYKKSAELGYWLGEPFWGKGIMTWAVSELCAEVFAKGEIIRIFAEPFAYNAGSRRVLEKAGFTLEGILKSSIFKNGVIADSCMYALLKD